MNKDLKSALIRYIYNGEDNILVTRDARLMGILNSYEPGVTPDPEDVERTNYARRSKWIKCCKNSKYIT